MKTKEKKQSKTKQNNKNKSNTPPPPPTRTTETTAKDFIYRDENCFSKAYGKIISVVIMYRYHFIIICLYSLTIDKKTVYNIIIYPYLLMQYKKISMVWLV